MGWLWLIAVVFGAAKYDTMGIWGWVLGLGVVALIAHAKNLYWKWMHRW